MADIIKYIIDFHKMHTKVQLTMKRLNACTARIYKTLKSVLSVVNIGVDNAAALCCRFMLVKFPPL